MEQSCARRQRRRLLCAWYVLNVCCIAGRRFSYQPTPQPCCTSPCRLNRDRQLLHDPAVVRGAVDGVEVLASLQWTSDSFSDTLVGYVNSIRTIDGGSHMEGLKAAVTRLVNNLAKKNKVGGGGVGGRAGGVEGVCAVLVRQGICVAPRCSGGWQNPRASFVITSSFTHTV